MSLFIYVDIIFIDDVPDMERHTPQIEIIEDILLELDHDLTAICLEEIEDNKLTFCYRSPLVELSEILTIFDVMGFPCKGRERDPEMGKESEWITSTDTGPVEWKNLCIMRNHSRKFEFVQAKPERD